MNRQAELAKRWKEQQEARRSGGMNTGGVPWFKVPGNSTVRLRFLPPMGHDQEGCEDMFFAAYGMHWNVFPGTDKPSVVCPRLTSNQSCPVCQRALLHRNEWKGGDAAAEAMFKQFRSTPRFLSQVVDLSGPETYKSGIQMFAYGSKIHDDLMSYMMDERNWGDFTDMAEGFVVNITAKGAGQLVQYTVSLDRQPSSFPEEYLALRKDLSQVIVVPTYEELETMLNAYDQGMINLTGQQNLPGQVPPPNVPNPNTPPPAQPNIPQATTPPPSVPAPQTSAPAPDVPPPAAAAPAPEMAAPPPTLGGEAPATPPPAAAAPPPAAAAPPPAEAQQQQAAPAVPNPNTSGSSVKDFLNQENQ